VSQEKAAGSLITHTASAQEPRFHLQRPRP